MENGRTYIYINGKRFIQCIRLILNISKADIPLYDEIDSIDEAAKIYTRHLHQNRIVTGPMAFPVRDQYHTITPKQEFWGHCSNIQAWVEHDYDTRILMSNISFPMLRELAKAGDVKARKVFKEEIALRLESGYPSVVQYLFAQGYIKEFTPDELQTILESSNLIEKLSSQPKILLWLLKICIHKIPTLTEDILLKILNLPNGKNTLLLIIQRQAITPFIPKYVLKYGIWNNTHSLLTLKSALENLFNRVDEKTGETILDCIQEINNQLELQKPGISTADIIGNMVLQNKVLDEKQKLKIMENLLKRQKKCSYCGKVIPKDRDICEWCGHKKDDDEGGSFPYPFIFKPPGGGGGTMKGVAVVPVKVKT
ncbi:MAG: hypothetical protein ACFFA2_01755 [Promethearchaeota archaeon]